MTVTLAHIWRHPVKGLGSEACQSVELTPEGAVEGDCAWAFLNAAAPDSDAWQPRRNYLQVAAGPRLAAITARSSGAGLTLTHSDRAPLALDPATPAGRDALADWIGDLWPSDRPGPARLVRAPRMGMTDSDFASVSIGNLASLRDLSARAGQPVDMRRFRINLWLDGLAPWAELDMPGGPDITLGSARLRPVAPIERCRAPDANPDTGTRDLGILKLLAEGWDTRDFGVVCTVSRAGTVSVGDALT